MKKLLLATSALAFAGQAFAADLPVRMPVKAPVVAVPYSWTGCYVGGHIGAGWDRTRFSDPDGNTIADTGDSFGINSRAGGLGGVQAGCDYQFANRWVIGLAGDFSWANINGAGTDPFFSGKGDDPIRLTTRTDTLATITGRVGYAFDNVLLYGKGGAAFAHNRYSLQNLVFINTNSCSVSGIDVACNATTSTDRAGWTIGAGFEWAFARNWSLMVEYDHYAFGNKGVRFTDPNAGPVVAVLNISQNIDVIKAGINFRFWQ
jgi:outer membrane immunogenic protein